jgi:hypothetical protein
MAVSRLSQQSVQNAFPKGNTIWDGTTATSAFDSLGVVVLTATTASITFSNIPQTYTHLQIRGVHRSTDSGASDVTLVAQFNGDTGSNYSYHRLYGYGSSASADAATSSSSLAIGNVATDGNTATVYTASISDILDYTSSVKHKTTKSLSGFDNNSNGSVHVGSGSWRASSITGITSILVKTSGSSFTAGTTISLYGIK